MTRAESYAAELTAAARAASRVLGSLSTQRKNDWLRATADALLSGSDEVLAANREDVTAAPSFGLNAAAVDRLSLDESRLKKIAGALREVADLADPVGETIEGYRRPNGLDVSRVTVPLGVVLFIYESRPNVTLDAAALCVKSGNAVILRGGKESLQTNLALFKVLRQTLTRFELPAGAVQIVDSPDRDIVGALLRDSAIDVTIPRGGKSLIERVTAEAIMPVIKHFDGICHVYVDQSAGVAMAVEILRNSKCQRTGVCNAAECLLIHSRVAAEFWTAAAAMLQSEQVQVRGCERTRQHWPWAITATDDDYRTEYLDLILSARVVDDIGAAIDHIARYGSHHTDAIVTGDYAASRRFVSEVDSAAVVVNASTRFNDGGELGLGAEIGISTDKFHARGPCGLRELCSYKWVVMGTGQVRS